MAVVIAVSACNSSDNSSDSINESGLQTMQSNGVERSYYIVQPEDDRNSVSAAAIDETKPLIIGFHGSFASHLSWIGETDRYGFVDQVGDEAIMVFPDALKLSENNINWNFDYDFLFFEDLLTELDRRGLQYDKSRLFVVGHSSGAGMANEIGCRYGDIVRAIAVSSGSLISGGSCIGSVGVIQTQGELDSQVPVSVGGAASNFWALYNGHDPETSMPGVIEPCIDYAYVAFPNENYPVQWCLHSGGHPWTDFNAEAFWTFFSGLPAVEPTADAPPGGGNEAALGEADTTMSFTLRYPEGILPVIGGSITLYPEEFERGQFAAPDVFLNVNWDPNAQAPGGQILPGTEVTYSLVPITFFVFSGEFDVSKTYKLSIGINVEGGSQPIPTPGIDQGALVPINFVDTTTPVIIEETIDISPNLPYK